MDEGRLPSLICLQFPRFDRLSVRLEKQADIYAVRRKQQERRADTNTFEVVDL